jgi:PAS domain S-box-containing protein
VLGVHARRPMSFGVDDVNFLQSIGNVLSEAIANDRYESDLLENRAKLEAHYAELETVYRQTPVGLAVLDQDLRFLRVNEVLANLNGVSIEDSIGKRISEVLPEELCSQMESVAIDVLTSGLSRENVELEGATLRDPHLRRHWLASYHPLRGDGSASSRLICVVNDVTSQKQASILRSAEHGAAQALTHAATFDEAIDAVLLALARPLGVDFAEYWHWPDAAGRPERAASCSVDPDGAPRSKPLQAIPLEVGEGLVRRACQEKGPAWLDSSERAPNGGAAAGASGLATSCAFPVRASDEIVGVIVFYARSPIEPSSALVESLAQIGRDLGQLWRRMQAEQAVRASEELFRSTIERAPIPICLHAFDGALLGDNRAFTAATGYSDVDLPEKRDWMRLLLRIPEDEIDEHISDLHRRLRSADEFPEPQDVDIVTRIGHKRRWRLYRCPPMRLANGREFATTMAVDLTDRKIAEEALAEAKETAEEVSRLKSAFRANVSHEIRTPMSAILGYADVLREDVEEPEQRRILSTIKRNGLYLVDLIDDILDLSRVEADQLEIVPERVALQRLVLDVASLMRVRAMEKGIELHVDFEGRVPETIETDPTRLRQILINLLGNAIKFTDEGQVRIRTLLREEGDAPCIQIEVIDTGIGIEDELRERLFDPFSRGSSTRSHARGGAGLGLAISQRLAGLMNGSLSVSSDASGSCFRLTLPAGDLDGIPRREMQDSVGDADRTAPSVGRLDASLRILVVDDHPDVREAVDSMLARIGARTSAAENGEEAIEAIAAAEGDDPFDVVLLDIHMPVLDGHETARKLRQRGYRGVIIALTAAATQADREGCVQSGCDDHLAKPVDRAALLEMLRRHARSGPDGAAPESEAAPNARRVLLVEDDEDARMALTQLLRRRAGIDLRATGTGAGALEQAASADWTPEVVLLDLTLPDMDGFEVLAALRKMPSLDDTLFVALTGRTEPEILDRATRSGIDEIVRKPVQDVGSLARLILVAE